MKSRSSSRKNKSARRATLIEALESRQMLSVSVSNGTLTITGTSGNDTITVVNDAVTKDMLVVSVNGKLNGVDAVKLKRINISALEGNDLVFIDQSNGAITLPINVAGGSGNDTMTGGSGPDILQGGRGDDVIRGSGGADELDGGVGNDLLYGGDGRDSLDGGAGADTIYTGGDTRDVIASDKQDSVDRSVPKDHTNVIEQPNRQPDFYNSMISGLTPDQVRAVYGLDSTGATGAGQTIAIVDAFDDPTVRQDLAFFSNQFNLTPITKDNFQVYYATKQRPQYDGSWAGETSLDVQWAHTVAPGARIILVEANSDSHNDLNQAISRAVQILGPAGGVISMSFGQPEVFTDPTEALRYHNAGTQNISFVSAAGDDGADVETRGAFPYVTSVGGTFLNVDPNTNTLITPEEGWTGSGGGRSTYFPRPDFQSGVTISGTPLDDRRAVPDVAFLADPRSSVAVYDTSPDATGSTGWSSTGGTSLATPMFAGFVALANELRANQGKAPIGAALNTALYAAAADNYAANFNDITRGTNGFPTYVGYDLVTGLGSPKPALATALANDNSSLANDNVSFQAAKVKLDSGLASQPPTQIIFGGTGSASKNGGVWDLELIANSSSDVSISLDGPLNPISGGRFSAMGQVDITFNSQPTQTYLLRVVAHENDNGHLVGEFYAVSSRGKIIYQGDKPLFYGTFTA